MTNSVSLTIGGRNLTLESGKLAEQADGAVTVTYGDTVVLVTVCMADAREGIDFFPLSVEFEERLYAVGRIPGSFFRREGRPPTDAILAARLTDRPIRPLFPKNFKNEVQIISTVLSSDQENIPDILSIIGASAALSISAIPFEGPISGARIGFINDVLVTNPTYDELKSSKLNLIVASSQDAIVMVEAGAEIVSEQLVLDAFDEARKVNNEIIDAINQLVQLCGKEKIIVPEPELLPDGLLDSLDKILNDRLHDAIFSGKEKGEKGEELNSLQKEVSDSLLNEYDSSLIHKAFDIRMETTFRKGVLDNNVRADGRKRDEIRPISCEVDILPRAHGSGLFTRGQTQILTTTTLGGLSLEQKLDNLSPVDTKRYMHHYNFPPFSVGEVRRLNTGRREIGHGALAERALEPVIPSREDFPYALRLVSEALSSNGSTSMGSVCGSTLSLMHAGVPIKAPVSGVAMGLIMGDNNDFAILTDIQGIEDHLGDMDFKVAGTSEGITALQMDIKVKGITNEIMEKALSQAKEARLFILEKMLQVIPEVNSDMSPHAPRVERISIPTEKIGAVIGPGGKMIRSIMEFSGASIDIEDDGSVFIAAPTGEALDAARGKIEGLTKEAEIGAIYEGKVVRLMDFGAFIEFMPGKDGLCHISELDDTQVQKVEDVVNVGDEVEVMVIEIDRLGRINLSRRAVLQGLSVEEVQASKERSRERRGPSGPPRRNYDGRGGNRNDRPQRRRFSD